MTDRERKAIDLTDPVTKLAKVNRERYGVGEILISETMRLNEEGSAEVLARERMNIVTAFEQVETYRGAAALCGTTHKTVAG